MHRFTVLAVSLALGLTACASSDTRRLEDAVRGYLADAFAESATRPGISVGFCTSAAGRDAGSVAIGLADREITRPLEADDRLLSGSIGKTYVAILALQLVATGELDLDAKANRYLAGETWFTELANADEITIRSLLEHSSGLTRYVYKAELQRAVIQDPDRVWTPASRLEFIRDDPARFDVGRGFGYADSNYIVLGAILERITGQDLYTALDRRVLGPAGLHDTVPADSRRVAGLVPGYLGTPEVFGIGPKSIVDGAFVINPQLEWAGGGFASTARDLARWAWRFGQGCDLPRPLWRRATTGIPAGRLGRYGFGVILRDTQLGPSLGHSGTMPGYLAAMAFYPELDLAVAVQTNTDDWRHELGMPIEALLDGVAERLASALGAVRE